LLAIRLLKAEVSWREGDEAAALEAEAELQELEFTEAVRSALTHDPLLPQAHRLLADHYRERHQAAEEAGDLPAAGRFEALLRAHDDGTHAGYLYGTGLFTLHTDPSGVPVTAARYHEQERVLRPSVEGRDLGPTPLDRAALPMGSYLLRIGDDLQLPLAIGRAAHSDRVRPGDDAPHTLRLPQPGELAAGSRLVPAGWFHSGGDQRTPSSLPGRRVWVDSFVLREHPVTHGEYLAFLNDVDVDEAMEHAPRERPSRPGERGALLLAHDPATGFSLREDAEGDTWKLDWPAWMVSWHGARAYAAWAAVRDGVPWRLPWELEWEKAARGVDGRPWPWGSFGDPTWAAVHGHRGGRPFPASIHVHPVDVSPFGVRGTAGNVCDWTLDVFTEEGPTLIDGVRFERPAEPVPDDGQLSRCVKGGSWSNPIVHGRGAFRDGRHAGDRRWVIGFRLARDW
jgi:serine/threonine-protein kinase